MEPADLLGFSALRHLAARLDSPMTIEYWKSAPYFISFCDTYRIGRDLKEVLDDEILREELRPELENTQRLSRRAVSRREQIDYGNARMRALAEATVDAGWWKLLWVPPSLPYLTPGGPYAEPCVKMMTKRLVFSSWAATPTAVAALLSHSAEHHIYSVSGADPTQRVAQRLRYRVEAGQAAAMTTLALFWPMPGLAALADPRSPRTRRNSTRRGNGTSRGWPLAQLAPAQRPRPKRLCRIDAWYWVATLHAETLPDTLACRSNPAEHVVQRPHRRPSDEDDADDPVADGARLGGPQPSAG